MTARPVRRGVAPLALGTTVVAIALGGLTACAPTSAIYPDSAASSPAPSASASSPAPTSSAPPATVSYTSDYGYSLMLPCDPLSTTAQQELMKMKVNMEVAQCMGDDPHSGVFVEALRFPKGSLKGVPAAALLKSSLTGLASTTGGKVVSQEDSKLDGSPALRAEVAIDGEPSDAQFVLALHGDVEYVMFALGDYAEGFEGYLDTFKFTH